MLLALHIALALQAPAAQDSGEVLFPGYLWQSLGQGIYLHRRSDPLAAPIDGNSVVIVNDEDVFVIDTHLNPAAARAVIARIRAITDRPVTHVINTHWHDDHVNGNQAFRDAYPGVRVIAHEATLASLRSGWQEMEDQRRQSYASVRGRDLEALAAAAEPTDPDRAMGLRMFAGYRDALDPELGSLELVYPDLTFTDELVFERGDRTIVVRWLGPGNTNGDAVVWLPLERLVVSGDVLVAPVPYAFDSPMREWGGTLDRIAELGARTIVPGHGAVMYDFEYLGRVRTLVEATLERVRAAHAAGVEADKLADAVDLSAFEHQFTGGDPIRTWAWRSFFIEPGLRSAWAALGLP